MYSDPIDPGRRRWWRRRWRRRCVTRRCSPNDVHVRSLQTPHGSRVGIQEIDHTRLRIVDGHLPRLSGRTDEAADYRDVLFAPRAPRCVPIERRRIAANDPIAVRERLYDFGHRLRRVGRVLDDTADVEGPGNYVEVERTGGRNPRAATLDLDAGASLRSGHPLHRLLRQWCGDGDKEH